MATEASQQRMLRRWWKRTSEALDASPAFQHAMRALRRRWRRHPFCNASPRFLREWCARWGREFGGRPYTKAYRCTKRLGTRYCWNWRVQGTTRCHRHQQEVPA
jgi:hypothetical protein